jgi:excisionase family DNA binding protein
MRITLDVADHALDELARRLADLLTPVPQPQSTPVWLDVAAAAEHLALTPEAVRALVKRRRIPHHRLENGRVRFDRAELDAWVRAGHVDTNRDTS